MPSAVSDQYDSGIRKARRLLSLPSQQPISAFTTSADPSEEITERIATITQHRPAPRQHARLDMLHRIFFVSSDRHWNIAETPLRAWITFLRGAGYDGEYDENPYCSELMRHAVVNSLLQARVLRLLRMEHMLGDGEVFLLDLALPSEHVMSCRELELEGKWNTRLCCPLCHKDPRMRIEHPLAERRMAEVCCRASNLLEDWYEGSYLSELPEHED